ncbi:Hexaprenyldihydroxybenzoate methyltransferase, mitochondrial [Balamuthia mandrillaris]
MLRLRPPAPFPDRLATIPPDQTLVDNAFYDSQEFSASWWDATSKGWAAGLHALNGVRTAYFHRVFSAHLGDEQEDKKIADIGCGGGIATEQMAKLGWNVTGVDLSHNSIATASAHAKENGVANVCYVVGDAYNVPLEDESVDGVIMSDVLEHLHDLDKAMEEVARILKPGGVLVFDTINRTWKSYVLAILLAQSKWLGMVPPHTHDHRMFVTPQELDKVMTKYGLVSSLDTFRGMKPELRPLQLLMGRGLWNGAMKTWKESNDLSGSYLGYALKKRSD